MKIEDLYPGRKYESRQGKAITLVEVALIEDDEDYGGKRVWVVGANNSYGIDYFLENFEPVRSTPEKPKKSRLAKKRRVERAMGHTLLWGCPAWFAISMSLVAYSSKLPEPDKWILAVPMMIIAGITVIPATLITFFAAPAGAVIGIVKLWDWFWFVGADDDEPGVEVKTVPYGSEWKSRKKIND